MRDRANEFDMESLYPSGISEMIYEMIQQKNYTRVDFILSSMLVEDIKAKDISLSMLFEYGISQSKLDILEKVLKIMSRDTYIDEYKIDLSHAVSNNKGGVIRLLLTYLKFNRELILKELEYACKFKYDKAVEDIIQVYGINVNYDNNKLFRITMMSDNNAKVLKVLIDNSKFLDLTYNNYELLKWASVSHNYIKLFVDYALQQEKPLFIPPLRVYKPEMTTLHKLQFLNTELSDSEVEEEFKKACLTNNLEMDMDLDEYYNKGL